ncbi:DUF7373 family lipoprotein [Rhodococcus sp. RDE2]|uniref:DUF7373 family lipoprotein n=1 Tax=Rhodococcus sp. RDE2 TaxID=2885078 RepID=UPI001E3C6BEF|nr:hypothetical protein [Rhodococcus sp. RDE2]
MTIAAAAAAAAGCASQGDAPVAVAETTTISVEASPVLVPAAPGELDPGLYRTTASEAHTPTVANTVSGQFVESERLAEFVALPIEIDPELVEVINSRTGVVPGPEPLGFLFTGQADDVISAIGEDTGFYAGFATGRTTAGRFGDGTTRQIIHAVLQFPDAEDAQDAAAALHRDRLSRPWSQSSDASPATEYPVASLPGSFISATIRDGYITGAAFTPHGRHVIYTWLDAPLEVPGWFDESLTTALEVQRPLIEGFPITDPEDLASLHMDLEGVLRLTVPFGPDEQPTPNSIAVYGPRGTAHLSVDQAGALDALTATGTTHLAVHKTNVYKSSTVSGAEAWFDRMPGLIRSRGADTSVTGAAGPAGVPNARCFDIVNPSSTFSACIVQHGQYVGEIFGRDLTDAHQLTTAQYLILDAEAADDK